MNQSNYLETIYNENTAPFTDYPKKLISYLFKRFKMSKNQKILELGCGRGEFLNEFVKCGLEVHGVDISDYSEKFFTQLNFKKIDMENEKLPYQDNYFDFIYSKSFIEHFYYPEKIFKEAYRVLKPGGMIITLTPEWKYIYKSFYEDFTHRVPFTKVSLKDIHSMNNFNSINVESFIQLPILFEKNFISKIYLILSTLTRILVPDYFRMRNKWIRFSKEIMLLSSARK
ncbi:class I SAM-dependent methyltransferase [Candidatus Pelagibacter sp.]|nr:class I SAM-dependent methyltransferase [Candidatus Pelagibacter sp.]